MLAISIYALWWWVKTGKVHASQRPKRQKLIPFSLAWSTLRSIATPPMSEIAGLHPSSIYRPGWGETKCSKVSCLKKMQWVILEPQTTKSGDWGVEWSATHTSIKVKDCPQNLTVVPNSLLLDQLFTFLTMFQLLPLTSASRRGLLSN